MDEPWTVPIANLWTEETFSATFRGCAWEFERFSQHSEKPDFDDGKCRNTYEATHTVTPPQTIDDAAGGLLGVCLLLSFATGRCAVPDGRSMMKAPDCFPTARAIVGLPPLHDSIDLKTLLAGLTASEAAYDNRRLRITFSHWLSALTCFSMEDMATFAFVIMDVVKQCEIAAGVTSKKLWKDGTPKDLEYFEGMEAAAGRYSLQLLPQDFVRMRNDLLHAGKLSDKNFADKSVPSAPVPRSKDECAAVLAEVLNWIDRYVLAVLNVALPAGYRDRWDSMVLSAGPPAISL